ncbi:MAG: Fic family protein [Endomicrobium sp.]|jgi:fido (protein-threonine AMPylation protein)|nr:Fic family protein [Endomicrobium sp.]
MSNGYEKLAQSLKKLQSLQNSAGLAVVKPADLGRTHLERLVKNGFLLEIIKGWYISCRPDTIAGDSTPWWTAFWFFVSEYANKKFGKKWCLSAEQSLAFYSGNITAPQQTIIRAENASNNIVNLLHNTAILYFKASVANPIVKENQFGLNLYSLPQALIECSPEFFRLDSISSRICLGLVDTQDMLKILLQKGQSKRAGRIAGALRNIAKNKEADEILESMKRAGFDIREENPFDDKNPILMKIVSPYAARLKLMWKSMRETVINNFPNPSKKKLSIAQCIKNIDLQYKADAYNSLSIEGYSVTDDLIEKVQSGKWNPKDNPADAQQSNAMAARGYWQTFQAVKTSIKEILKGKNAGAAAKSAHRVWYQELFAPSVMAGLLRPEDLAGYRSHQVYIKNSMHTPLNPQALKDAMPVLFDLLKKEESAAVRAILGHFFFVYIHPYMDGNGRLARFLMNVMLTTGGYSWTIIPVKKRKEYMTALEKASVKNNIKDFTKFIADCYKKGGGNK